MYFIDVQGTLIDDKYRLPIKGAVKFIDTLNNKNIPYIVITNNTKEKSESFFKYLNSIGFNIKKENYIDPFYILRNKIQQNSIAIFGTDEFCNIVESFGYENCYDNPDAMVVSIDYNYTNEDYGKMIETAFKVPYIYAMHETSTFAINGKRYPGLGAIMKMIQFATNKNYTIIGKPSLDFFETAKRQMAKNYNISNINYGIISVISDDMFGDLIGAQKLGMKSILVLSGKTKNINEVVPVLEESLKPEMVFKDINEMLKKVDI